MARKLRIEYAGAVYHVMNRGDRQEAIFEDDADRQRFLETLTEVCLKAGWQVHAYCLMGNHFHLVVETPQANLVAGVQERRAEERSEQWKPVRRGWCLGEEQFRKELLEQVHQMARAHHYGEEIGQSAEEQARGIIAEELTRLGWKVAGRRQSWVSGGRRHRQREARAAVAAGNDRQQVMDRRTIGDGVGEQRDVCLTGSGNRS